MTDKNARLYCNRCKCSTEHVKMSAPMGQSKALGDINEQFLGGNKIVGGVAQTYGAIQGLLFEVVNGVSQSSLGKSVVTYWMCETCERIHERYLED
jgi:ribosomal protein L44E